MGAGVINAQKGTLTNTKLCKKWSMCRHKIEGLSISYLGIFFPTSTLISRIFMTSHGSFLTQYESAIFSCYFQPIYLYTHFYVFFYSKLFFNLSNKVVGCICVFLDETSHNFTLFSFGFYIFLVSKYSRGLYVYKHERTVIFFQYGFETD